MANEYNQLNRIAADVGFAFSKAGSLVEVVGKAATPYVTFLFSTIAAQGVQTAGHVLFSIVSNIFIMSPPPPSASPNIVLKMMHRDS